MAELYKKFEVKVVAEYWATIELEVGEEITEEQLHERAWRDFYDEAHRASIEEVHTEDENQICSECYEEYVDDDHICEEESEEEESN